MTKLIPLSEWNDHAPWPSVKTLREWYRVDLLGFCDECTVRGPGKDGRILVDLVRFHSWIRSTHEARDAS